jgi:acylpyruvate hydrolase
VKFVSFTPPGTTASRPGALRNGTVIDLGDTDLGRAGLDEVFSTHLDDPEAVSEAIEAAERTGDVFDRESIEMEAPVAKDARVISLGGAFASHLRERRSPLNKVPSQWVMPDTSVIGPNDPIELDERVRENTLPAVELGVVIGRRGSDISETTTHEYVAGFTIVNDITARTEWPGAMAYKLMDTFCPCGPHVVTPEEVTDPHDLDVEIRQSGEKICAGRTAGLRFTISFMISYISTILTLRPGDVIATGDPGDVQDSLAVGETIELEIEDIGVLKNPVRAAEK